MTKLRSIMFVGTGSDVGKSIINAAFCRIFKNDGYNPAPFKAQNMSLNSFATPDGLEIGRAQAVQAEACGIDCRVEMNPVLLKPTSYQNSQVVLNGKPIGNKSAREYFNGTDRDMLFAEAMKSFNRLAQAYNPVVIEGAGSISEMNLWDKDITNMRVALAAKSPTFLVADIDKGGVIASVYGTIKLIPKEERDLIKGIIINKFRGDISLFTEGKKIIEELTGKPVVGIIPYFRDIHIEQEDSVVLDYKTSGASDDKINIAVVLLKHMSNFTDFNMLEQIPGVHLYYTANSGELAKADIIIIPGSKNTMSDLQHLRNSGLAKTILEMHRAGKQVYGICGGYQVMGEEIHDPHGVEGDVEFMPGLGILPVKSILTKEKTTEQCSFIMSENKLHGEGYEIHMGITEAENENPFSTIDGNKPDGYFLNPKTWGTYIHGVFDNENIVQYILNQCNTKVKVRFDYQQFKEEQYDKLAELVRNHVDMDFIYNEILVDE
ncbi:MAG: cobyric acid synthase [Bacteroidales bacterium]|nr:cobyric acid synthase [Bacteroidales bacterium]